MRIAFIVQRYGLEILGGSEYHCRLIAERMAGRRCEVDVLTTCARDYISWANEYPEGPEQINGVTVRRFANDRTRDIEAFNRFSDWIFQHPHTRDDELSWLEQQGPWCPALVEHVARTAHTYDALIFFTYLYAPTVLSVGIDPGRSILVPTAHDEPAIHLDIYRQMFRTPAAIAFNTEIEKAFLGKTFEFNAIAAETVGCGVDLLGGQPQANHHPPKGFPGRPVRHIWRPHRSWQGLRRSDRSFRSVQRGRGRGITGAHGLEAHAAARSFPGCITPACCLKQTGSLH